MKWFDRIIIYCGIAAALAGGIIANIRVSQLDDETHNHLTLQAKASLFMHHQIDSLATGTK